MIPFLPFAVNTLPIFNQIAIILINAFGVALVITVLNHVSLKEKLGRSFLLMAILMFFWINFAYLARLVGVNDLFWSEFFLRIAWVATPLFFAYVFFMSILITGLEKHYRHLSNIVLGLALITAGVTYFTNFIVDGVSFVGTDLTILYGQGFFPFLAVITFFIVATIIPLWQTGLNNLKPGRGLYFVIGVAVFYALNALFNILLPAFFNITHLYFIGDYSLVFIVGMTSFSILRFQLLNVKVIGTELLVFALWAFLFLKLLVTFDPLERITTAGLLVAMVVVGIYLMRSVVKEVETRKQVEKLAASLEKANERLKELDKLKSQFLSIASHDLRAPLTAIRNFMSILLEGTYGKLPPAAEEGTQQVFNRASEMAEMVDDYLNVSRIEQGRMKYDFKDADFAPIINETMAAFKSVAKEKNLTLNYTEVKEPLVMKIDDSKMREVLENLVNNAINYTPEGSIAVELEKAENTVRVTFVDTGIGMSKETIQNLFKFLTPGEDSRKYNPKSTGVGLYITKAHVDAHKGKIWAESDGKDKGSRFIIELPLG